MANPSQRPVSFSHVAHVYDTLVMKTQSRIYMLIKTMKYAYLFKKICNNMHFNILKTHRKI